MMLYRPFLHYISPRLSTDKVVDRRYYACAAAGVSVSRNILHISTEIENQALVVGPFWSMLYTEFFAVLSLVFYVLENKGKQGSMEIYADANAGREMLAKMAHRSLAADRIVSVLNTLWENLPEAIKNGKVEALPSRKRSAPGPKLGPRPLSTNPSSASSKAPPIAASRNLAKQRLSHNKSQRPSAQSALSSTTYPELHVLDAPSSGAPPDDTSHSTPPSASRYICPDNNGCAVDDSSLYKLDAHMFPSGDPFAYPNQPLAGFVGLASTHEETNPSHISAVHGGQQADTSDFYLQRLYAGNIEGQLGKYCQGPIF